MVQKNLTADLCSVLMLKEHAFAQITGSDSYPEIKGIARFYATNLGTLVCVEASGLPIGSECASPILALHIHTGNSCSGNETDPFADALTHYNPENCPHPYHAGDLPPLFSNNGYALSVFLTNRITLNEIIGKTVILHSMPDDFTTQPSGNSGVKIACGVIRQIK